MTTGCVGGVYGAADEWTRMAEESLRGSAPSTSTVLSVPRHLKRPPIPVMEGPAREKVCRARYIKDLRELARGEKACLQPQLESSSPPLGVPIGCRQSIQARACDVML